TITVNPADMYPEAHFTPSSTSVEVGGEVSFEFDGEYGDPDATFLWDFDDGTTSTDRNPTHQFTSRGTYNVNLTVTDADGDVDFYNATIVVTPIVADLYPYASFKANATIIVQGQFVSFEFNGDEGDGSLTFYWDFGDETSSTDENPIHRFTNVGKYNVTLLVRDVDGDPSFAWLNITVVESLDIAIEGLTEGGSIVRDSNFEIRVTLDEDVINDVSVRVIISGPVQAPIRNSGTDFELEMVLESGAWVGYWDASACALGDYAITITVFDKNDNVIQTQSITVTLESEMHPPSTGLPVGVVVAVIGAICAVAILMPGYVLTKKYRNKKNTVRNKELNKFPKPRPKSKSDSPNKYRSAGGTADSMLELQKTESELEIFEDRDVCQIHKGFIKGVIFSCPKCKAKYCMKCARLIAQKDEGCWLCGQDFRREIDALILEDLEANPIELKDIFDEKSLQDFLKESNLLNALGEGCVTLVPPEFLIKVDSLSWESNEDKIQFLKEIMAVPSEIREECIEEMIRGLQDDFDGNNGEVL
ncbi:MAG: PKD domain-containing protein, partial [Candidatus Lokiarchaeota archaeon]|nr:PKD domain-containing protein [Candidatus Lokiarchaeota archaeon]